ncbi:MAG: imidazole glycerol phosphate synthase subunit HisF [Thermoanaerobaculia bacterium]
MPCLDVRDGRVVKGVRFRGLRDAGDPAVLAAAYAGAAADELVLLDVSATPEGRATAVRTVREVRRVLPLPLTVGGGVRSVDDAVRLLDAGADKVAVNTAAVENPELLTALAARCGRQCVVVAVDAARGGDLTARPPSRAHRHAVTSPRAGQKDGRGWKVVVRSGRRRLDLDAVAWCRRAVEAGAGEILLTSWDRDGTGDGYDSELIAAVRAEVEVSIVASGGAGRAEHLAAAVAAGADAVLLASRLHLGELSIAELKAFLFHRGFEVRS